MSGLQSDDYRTRLRAQLALQEEGRRALDPVVVLLDDATDLGFVKKLRAAARFKRRQGAARLVGLYREGSDFRDALINRCPAIDQTLKVPADARALGLVDWFDAGWEAPRRCPNAAWFNLDLHRTTLVLNTSLLFRLAGEESIGKPPTLSGWAPPGTGQAYPTTSRPLDPLRILERLCQSDVCHARDELTLNLAMALGVSLSEDR